MKKQTITEEILNYYGNALPPSVAITLANFNKPERNFKGYQSGAQVTSSWVDKEGKPVDPNDADIVFSSTTGTAYNTSTGLPVVQIDQYETEDARVAREARQGANKDFKAFNNNALVDRIVGAFSSVEKLGRKAAGSLFDRATPGGTVLSLFDKSPGKSLEKDVMDSLSQAISSRSIENQKEVYFDAMAALQEQQGRTAGEAQAIMDTISPIDFQTIELEQQAFLELAPVYAGLPGKAAPRTVLGPPRDLLSESMRYDIEMQKAIQASTDTTVPNVPPLVEQMVTDDEAAIVSTPEFDTKTPIDTTLQDYERAEQAMATPISTPISTPPQTQSLDQMATSTPANLSASAPATPSIAGTFEGDASAVTPSAAPTVLGLPIEYSYPGEDRSSRANFSSQDAEGYSGEGVNIDAAAGYQGETGFGSAQPGPFSDGGSINMQEGGEVDNADTDLESRLGPMGIINDLDGDPGPSQGGAGVSDDLEMEVSEGSYILNADAVALIGVKDVNAVIRDAYTIAAATEQELPADYDPQNKVPIRISNGEAVIPAALVKIIGLDQLEKWNAKGLAFRKQKEKMMAEQQQEQEQVPQDVAEASPVQPQSPMQDQMSGLMGYRDGTTVFNPETATAEDMQRTLRGPEGSLGPDKEGNPIPNPNRNIRVYSNELSDEEISKIIKKHYGGTPPKEFREYFYKDNPRTIEEVFQSLKNAEWRNTSELQNNDTLKFTGLDTANKKGKFSSAFGDIQITVTRAEDLLKLIPEENSGLKEYTEKFIKQGNARISQLQHLNSAKIKRMKKQNLPIPRPDFNLLGKGEGNISKEEHAKYYRELSNLHLNDILKRIRLAEIE